MKSCSIKKRLTIQCLFIAGISCLILLYMGASIQQIGVPMQSMGCLMEEVQPEKQYLPHFFSMALDDSDMDVRDKQNRPVKSSSAHAALKELFILTVFNCLVEDNLPLISSIRKYLEELLTPFSEQLNRVKRWMVETIELAVLFSFKRLSELLVNHSLLLTVYILHDFQILHIVQDSPQGQSQLNLPLRC